MAAGAERRAGGRAPRRPIPLWSAAAAMVFVEDPAAPVLTEGDAHHLLDVLRLRPGESVVAGDGRRVVGPVPAGRRRPADGDRRSTRLRAGGRRPADHHGRGPSRPSPWPSPRPRGTGPSGWPRSSPSWGWTGSCPCAAARSVVRWDGDRGERAVDRLRRVAREAAAQCRRPWLPEVTAVTTLDGLASASGGRPQPGPARGRAALPGPSGGGGGARGRVGRGRAGPFGGDRWGWARPCSGPRPRPWPPAPPVRSPQRPGRDSCVTTLREQNYTEGQAGSPVRGGRAVPIRALVVSTCACVTVGRTGARGAIGEDQRRCTCR